jgi:hypothetical protein
MKNLIIVIRPLMRPKIPCAGSAGRPYVAKKDIIVPPDFGDNILARLMFHLMTLLLGRIPF